MQVRLSAAGRIGRWRGWAPFLRQGKVTKALAAARAGAGMVAWWGGGVWTAWEAEWRRGFRSGLARRRRRGAQCRRRQLELVCRWRAFPAERHLEILLPALLA